MNKIDFHMKVDQGADKGEKFEVTKDALVLGSGSEADVVIQGPGVEPCHAQVVFQGGRVILTDLSKESGTFRNGQRLLGPIQVFPGDRIGLGPEVVLILEGSDPTETARQESSLDELADDPGLAPDSPKQA